MKNMKNWEMIPNCVKVEARGGVAFITNSTSYELRLLGTSCNTNCELYKVTDGIMLSLEKGKSGFVALSVCTPDKSVCGREIFEVTWTGENKDKILVNLRNPCSSEILCPGSVSDNGFEVQHERHYYRIPWVFFGDTEISVNPEKALQTAKGYTGAGYHVFRDGNVFCRFLVGDANMNDIEASHLQYKMEDLGFLKRVALSYVEQGYEIEKLKDELTYKKNNLQEQFEISDRLETKNIRLKGIVESAITILSQKMTIGKYLKQFLGLRRSKASRAHKILSDGLTTLG